MRYDVLWHCTELRSSEVAVLDDDPTGPSLRGTTALERDGVPCLVTSEVVADARWRTTSVTATVAAAGDSRRFELAALDGVWTREGRPAPELEGCTDVDLGWTPSTNTLPIRRVVASSTSPVDATGVHTIRVALLRFPELDLAAAEQTYERLAEDRWRFAMDDFTAELVVDPASGLVLAYGTDLWRGLVSRR